MKQTKKEVEAKILEKIYDLILDSAVTEIERTSLVTAKSQLEKQQYFPRVMNDLEANLRPLAIKGELSEPAHQFYKEIATIGKFEKELGRGLTSMSLPFIR